MPSDSDILAHDLGGENGASSGRVAFFLADALVTTFTFRKLKMLFQKIPSTETSNRKGSLTYHELNDK